MSAAKVEELARCFDLPESARKRMAKAATERLDPDWDGSDHMVEREVLCYMQGWVDARQHSFVSLVASIFEEGE
jgi:hypothetical protein